ncbi:hypothetical protein D3C86_1869200 [compost metagenome]
MIWRSLSSLPSDGLIGVAASRASCSSSMALTSASCSGRVSHLASWGLESSQNQTNTHNPTENMPSMKYIHCQPCMPRPLICRSSPDSGPEISEAIAEPLRKIAIALPRSTPGNQRVK